ncbi:MAG: hypothetical protein JRH16_21905 [Deltaproteobacteria bacterium]|nr:hypothetical protein [Deltaproteobacteria bacterium]
MNARALLVIAALVALVGGGYMAAGRFEGTPPSVVAPEQLVVGKAGATLSIEIEDPASGLRELSIRLLHEAGSQPLSDHSWPGGLIEGGLPGGRTASIEIEVDPVAQRLPDGKATLVISVRDWSWRDGFSGNRSELSVPVVIDTRPPRVSVQSGLTYVYRGGSAAAVYRVDSDGGRLPRRLGCTRARDPRREHFLSRPSASRRCWRTHRPLRDSSRCCERSTR